MKRIPTVLIGLTAAALALSACTSASDLEKKSGASAGASAVAIPVYDNSKVTEQKDISALLPDSVKSDGKLSIGASTDYAPAEFLDPAGKAVGYDVDFAKALGKVLGLEVEVTTAEFDSIIPAVGTKYDLGISSFTITKEREESATLVSYINVGSQFNVAKGNPKKLDVSDTINLCGLTIGVQTGTAQEEALQGYSKGCQSTGHKAIDIKSYAAHSDAATALAGGAIDATFSDSTVAGYAQIQTGGQVETVGEVMASEPQGVVVASADQATADAVQKAIQYLMDQGIWKEILKTWGIDESQALETAEINPQL
ncbi:Glutamine-binding periplasmic protein precursor [Actinomyces bovis]|uniref:Glutamine-binding periplasmic protein n=1 Tax=Actinomyces bovis TaxID=1658 RepID=A0ABY1VPR6_9ACTO|nr:ABC transporter substrate-binding protein [Actinomyces bovis]SPT54120.1 Glutamine-binding periplasmic protein precursor [Actinomyces bovis]VEG53637.1 Glutamine-binding periplasmic protein precursor [Actinomyces israelii]